MEEKNKISKIVEEMTLYLLNENLTDFSFHFKYDGELVAIIFEVNNVDDEIKEFIDSNLAGKRNDIIEEYGWELMGEGDLDNCLELISSLIDECELSYADKALRIRMVRYE